MSFLAILAVIGVIASIVNAMQPKKSGSRGFRTRLRAFDRLARNPFQTMDTTPIEPTIRQPKPTHAIEEAEGVYDWNDQRDTALIPLPKEFDPEPLSTDYSTDFGDTDPDDASSYARMPAEQDRTYIRPSEALSQKKHKKLDLKPTPKKLAESFILAECFGEPRARRPFSPIRYQKRP